MLASGTTTVECKTGYGLSTEEELRGLAVIDALSGLGPWRLIPTFLGAHAVPPEHRDDRERYVEILLEETLPRVAEQGVARFCDIFIERGAFTVEEGRRIMTAARERGLIPKLHVDEFTALGGSALAAEVHAISADHLEEIPDAEIDRLAEAGVIGVLMPGVNYFLGNHAYAPARTLIERGVAVAIATDFNPGSCMCHSMEMVLSLAATQLKLRPAEAIAAATRNAAYACGMGARVGRLEAGFAADLVVMDVDDPRTLAYHFGTSHVRDVVVGGEILVGWG
jgi:imidazolonepropionase